MSRTMIVRRLEIRRLRGFENLTLVPHGHVALVGEPRAGRSDVIESLRRVLLPDSTRVPLTDDIDFYQRDRTFRAEAEVVLGDLGPVLTQQFLDRLEFWNMEDGALVELLDDADALADEELEPVVRLCYRTEWSHDEELAHHWVDYPKTSDPGAGDFDRVRRADRETLPFFATGTGARPLSLMARAILRRLVDEAQGADFADHLEQLLDEIRAAAAGLGGSVQVRTALERVAEPARLPLDAAEADINDLLRFTPEGGVVGAVLRSLAATLDLGEGVGFIPLDRHGSTVTALFAVCELLAVGGAGVIAFDDLGEDLDAATAHHLTAVLGSQARQVWVTTRRAPVAEAFRPGELIRLGFDDAGTRVPFPGWEPADKAERMFTRQFALQVLPAVAARALILLEGPHDRAAYGVVAERLFRDEGVPLPAARRIAFADAGAAGAGGSSVLPKLAAGAGRLGFFTAVILDGDKDETAIQAATTNADLVIRLPERHAVERAILHGVADEAIRTALQQLDVVLPANLPDLGDADLRDAAVAVLKQRGGVHSQFLEARPAGVHPSLARTVLDTAVEGILRRQRGLVQL
jgi:putative ATP-dependent endonuclease of OLD family